MTNGDDTRESSVADELSAVTKSAEAEGSDSIISIAFCSGIAIQAVASASAIIQFSAITVTESVVVTTGCPVVALIVCPFLPFLVSRKFR